MENCIGSKSMLARIYEKRQEEIEEGNEVSDDGLTNKIVGITIATIIDDVESGVDKEEIIKKLRDLEEDNNIRLSYYNEEYYKIGFKDGINLYEECRSKDNYPQF